MRRFILLALLTVACGAIADEAADGYWKFHVAPLNKPFGNDDVVALAQGRHVATDCSVPWIGGDGNTYCFKDIASRETFLHAPMDYFRQAQAVVAREHGCTPQSARTRIERTQAVACAAQVTQEKTRC